MKTLALVALASTLAATGCTKDSFKGECSDKHKAQKMTVRGVFLHPSGIFFECDDVKTTYGNPGAKPRGCQLPLYTKEGGSGPPIVVYLPMGTDPRHIKPVPEHIDWQKDVHVVTDDGGHVEFGDVVELTGELDTHDGDCGASRT